MADDNSNDFVLLLQSKKNTLSSLWLKYLSIGKEKRLVAFVEGNTDVVYYTNAIQEILGSSDFAVIDCGNKNLVLSFRGFLVDKEGVIPPNVAFFVDSDCRCLEFNSSQYFSDVFFTKGYSIENYFFNDSSIVSCLISGLALTKGSENFDEILTSWVAFKGALLRYICVITAALCVGESSGLELEKDKLEIGRFLPKKSGRYWKRPRGKGVQLLKNLGLTLKKNDLFEIRRRVQFVQAKGITWGPRGRYLLSAIKEFMKTECSGLIKTGAHTKSLCNVSFLDGVNAYRFFSRKELIPTDLVSFVAGKAVSVVTEGMRT